MTYRAATVLVLSLAAAGCASGGEEAAAPPQSPHGASVLTAQGGAATVPFAASGTPFEVRLDQPLDTQINYTGQPISATLVQPIKASDGSVLVPAGTKIRGRVAGVDHQHGPALHLDFDTLALDSGDVPIGTRVLSAQQSVYRAIPVGTGVTSAQGGVTEAQGTEQLTMPVGGVVQLALTRPIIQGAPLQPEKKE